MRVYKVTHANRRAVYGLIEKFMESCKVKRHVYKCNRQIIFPYLTDKQVKNAAFAIPVARTCYINGLRSGDVVTFYGGNRIVIKHPKAPEDILVRIVPKDEEVVNKFLSMLARPIPKIKPEFLFDRAIMTGNRKRYATTVPLRESVMINPEKIGKELKQLATAFDKAEVVEDFDDQSLYPSRLTRFEILSNLTVSELQGLLDEFMKMGLISLPTPPHPPLATTDFDGDYSPDVDDPAAELAAKVYAHTRHLSVSTSCEAMYLDD